MVLEIDLPDGPEISFKVKEVLRKLDEISDKELENDPGLRIMKTYLFYSHLKTISEKAMKHLENEDVIYENEEATNAMERLNSLLKDMS